ncbi:MAG: enoyl-CoA hydratase/isomerase family protein [Deltaproteobacteria bacterium]|nr:enoyl-CoA hydratase/isomerase family protein [Deltaproteobacteria bacterium]
MKHRQKLYPEKYNPLLIKPEKPLPREVAIIGCGTIGPDIGYYLKSVIPGLKLFLVDVVESQLENAEKRINTYVKKAIAKKKMDERNGKSVLADIVTTTDYSKIGNCDLVIEAATENLDLKRKIFRQVEQIVRADTLITSNTSSIPADRIFSEMVKPERTTVTHFFAPAWRNPLVEVITWDKVDRDNLDYLCWMFCSTGKTPIISDNAICFILDRVFDNWCNEAAYLLENTTAAQVDKVATEFVFAGPFYVLNMANGNPIIVETNTLQMEEGKHYRPAEIFNSVDRWLTLKMGEALDVPDDVRKHIRDRLLGILFSQSFDIINRGIGTPEDLNMGCQLALGFRKGPLDIMRDLGEEETFRVIQKFRKDRPGFPGPEETFYYYQNFKRHILIDVVDGVKVVTIRRPQFLNALNDEVNHEIRAAIEEDIENPEIKGFVITGYGDRAFCSGGEIGKFPELLGDSRASIQYSVDCSELLTYLDTVDKPVVAAVNGMALGGGVELAIRCHQIVATSNAHFQFPEITLGILPGIGGCIVPYRKWPEASEVFHDMLRFGKTLTVEEAKQAGMVTEICDDYAGMIQKAIDEVNALQGKIERIREGSIDIAEILPVENPVAGKLALSREAVAILEQTIKEGAAAETLKEALEIGYKGFGVVACTDAAREGIFAFQERRKPEFRK